MCQYWPSAGSSNYPSDQIIIISPLLSKLVSREKHRIQIWSDLYCMIRTSITWHIKTHLLSVFSLSVPDTRPPSGPLCTLPACHDTPGSYNQGERLAVAPTHPVEFSQSWQILSLSSRRTYIRCSVELWSYCHQNRKLFTLWPLFAFSLQRCSKQWRPRLLSRGVARQMIGWRPGWKSQNVKKIKKNSMLLNTELFQQIVFNLGLLYDLDGPGDSCGTQSSTCVHHW